ncbi:MAG TPA: acid shock protein [Labilithrix sp.]|nr:acid shock protein [Labilithrix sp.]
MRSPTLISFGAFAAATLALSAHAWAQKPGATKPATESGTSKPPDSKPSATKGTTQKGVEAKGADTKSAEANDAETKSTEVEPPATTKAGANDEGATFSPTIAPPADEWDNTDVEERAGKSYFFVGLRYRGNIIPQFMLNLFVEQGQTIYTNLIGVEFDLRKDGFSLIPALSYHELGTGDILFKQKNTKDIVSNYSLVNSGLKVLYASVDLLWSTKLHKNVEFEYGAGFGLGAVFGDLENSWVREDPQGQLVSESGRRLTRCNIVAPAPGTGCHPADHQNSPVNKVNGYKEPSWFSGGSKPVLFPWIAVPQIGLRFKPIKEFVARLGVGFALTGFWFGLSAQYGLEKHIR